MGDGVKLFGREDMLWAQRFIEGADMRAARLSSPKSEARTPGETSISFAPSGFTFMRSDWSRDARYMLINHGPSGGGHSHADVLDFEMHAYGQACAIDSGIGYTYDDPQQKPWYVRTRAHNGITIDDLDLNRRAAEGRDVVWTALAHFDYFAATHLGYLENAGVTHRRHIAFIKPDYWLIYDCLQSACDSEHLLKWNLHCPTPMEVHQDGFASKSSPGLIVLPASDWKASQDKGWACVRGIRGHEGLDYAEIDWISFENRILNQSAGLGVLLSPFADHRPEVKLTLVKQDQLAAHFRVDHPGGSDHIFFGEGDHTLESEKFTFNGASAVARMSNDRIERFSVAQSRALTFDGRRLVDSPQPCDREG